ncbi:hypothetical protein BD410DRAFT_897436 [Rickenella mellea]|uniref:Uncharacterized protein n=1 Tax=Rickenella mellea TaxID=50990 RepID=A0A4Y7Q861_9AGAM|nr:hypothetical protein BD410DRAFT_897436 [Rickenella mellea]
MSSHPSDTYWGKLITAHQDEELKRYGIKKIDFEQPIPPNAGTISWTFPVYDTRRRASCKVVARVTPAENGMGGYLLDFVYDGSSACGKDGELVDRTDYFQVPDMHGRRMPHYASVLRQVYDRNHTGAGRAADLAGEEFVAYLATVNWDKQVYPLAPTGYYELVVGPHRKRILFDYNARNSSPNTLPRALFVVEE